MVELLVRVRVEFVDIRINYLGRICLFRFEGVIPNARLGHELAPLLIPHLHLAQQIDLFLDDCFYIFLRVLHNWINF